MFKKYSFFLAIFFSIFSFLSSFSNNLQNYMSFPVKSQTISSTFGYRKLFNKNNFHDGIDYALPKGTPVYATSSGIVTFCSFTKTGYGNAIILLHSNGLKSLYGHLDETFIVSLGQTISQGELIGYIGPKYLSNGKLNGNTTGPHLHFSIFNKGGKAVDPLKFEYKKKDY